MPAILRLSFAATVVALVAAGPIKAATTTYTYNGSAFTQYGGLCSPPFGQENCGSNLIATIVFDKDTSNLTGSFSVSDPDVLSANLYPAGSLLAEAFTIGITGGSIELTSGVVTSFWESFYYHSLGSGASITPSGDVVTFFGAGVGTGTASSDTAGTWSLSVSPSASPTPLPVTWPLFATGLSLFGLIRLSRKRKVVH